MSSTNDNDNENSIPNNKIPIKDESKDYYEIEKSKDYIISKFGGTKRTLLSTIISSIYTLTFFILLIRTVFNYIVGLFFLISITCVYFSVDNMNLCPTVKYVDLAYIIVEWVIFSTCIILHYAIVIFFVCCKAKRKYWDGSGEVDPEEIKKVI